jgi:hypothetical protein
LSDIDVDGEADKAGQDNKKRRVIVDRYARFKIDEAAMAQVAANAVTNGASKGAPMSGGPGPKLGENNRAFGSEDAGQPPLPGGPLRQKRSASDGDTFLAKAGSKDYMGEPYRTGLLPGEEIVYDRSGRKTFLGAPAGKSMLRRVSIVFIDRTDI